MGFKQRGFLLTGVGRNAKPKSKDGARTFHKRSSKDLIQVGRGKGGLAGHDLREKTHKGDGGRQTIENERAESAEVDGKRGKEDDVLIRRDRGRYGLGEREYISVVEEEQERVRGGM